MAISLCSAVGRNVPLDMPCNPGNWNGGEQYFFNSLTKQVFNECQELIGTYEVIDGIHRITNATLEERQAYRKLLADGLVKDWRENGIIPNR